MVQEMLKQFLRTREVEAMVSQDCATALQPGQKSETLKKKKKKEMEGKVF